MIHYALVLCLAAHLCVSTSVFSKDGKYAEEEFLDGTTDSIFQDEIKNREEETPLLEPTSKELKDSNSAEVNESNEETKQSTLSSESLSSSSSSSSEEVRQRKKRSLDSKPESTNSIGQNTNQTTAKTNNIDKNTTSFLEVSNSGVMIEYPTDGKPKESPTENTDTLLKSESEIVAESESEVTTGTNEAETTTASDSQTTTDANAGMTESDKITTESEPETESDRKAEVSEITPENNLYATADSESVTTTEVNADHNIDQPDETPEEEITSTTEGESTSTTESESTSTTESESITTTEKHPELTQSSSEVSEELPYYSPSTTPSTDMASTTPGDSPPKTMMEVAMDRVNKLSDQIRLVLTTYKKVGVVVVPGQSFFPEPMAMQDFRQSFSVGTMDFKNMRVYGLSNFTVEHINTDVDRMQVYILLHMKKLVILGNYTLRTFFSRAAGPFNVTLLDVDSEGVAEIQTAPEGHLEAADSEMDMFTKDMRVDFKNLGFMGSMFQGVVSAVGDALFNSIKPQILERVNLVIRTDVNKKLKEFSTKFINKVNPVDLAFSEGRRYCKAHGYDPYNIKDHTFILGGLVYLNITDFWVEGLSRFHRVGNLSLSMDAGVIEIAVHVLTGKLTGHCHWTGQTFGIVKYGKTNFTVDHLQVRAMVHQSLDVRKKPQLHDLDLELGWVKVTMNSPMTLSLMIEGIINAFPRLIRHIIVDTLEQPLKEKIQEILDKINVEAIVDEHLPQLDNFGL